MLARGQAHLGLGGRAHALDPTAARRDDALDRGRRVDRHRDDAGTRPHRQRGERGEEVHVVHDASAIVDDEDLLAAGIDDHPERCPEGRHEHGELAQLVLELLERTRADVLGHDAVDRHDVDLERVEELRQVLGRGAVAVVHDDLVLRLRDLALSCDLREEGLAVRLADARRFKDASDVLVRHASEVLAEEDVLDLPLLRLVHVERLPIEELHVADAHVERGDAHVHAARGADAPGVEPTDRQRRLREVGDVHARAHDAAHEATLEHAARAVLVPVHRDRRSERQRRRVGRAEACDELRREVDVHEARDTEAAEERAAALRAPDEARADDGAGLDLLVGPDLHLRAYARVLVHDRVVADHAAFLEDDPRLQRTLAADDRAV